MIRLTNYVLIWVNKHLNTAYSLLKNGETLTNRNKVFIVHIEALPAPEQENLLF